MNPRVLVLASFALQSACTTAAPGQTSPRSSAPPRPSIELAVTIDDVPFSSQRPIEEVRSATAAMLHALADHHAPATAFVVCGRTEGREDVVRAWIAAGHELGNHSMHHTAIDAQTHDAWRADVARCNAWLAGVTGKATRYYRYPYLQSGETVERRDAGAAALRELGVKNAPVSVDTADWVANRAYEDAKDDATRRTIGDAYVAHVVDAFRHYRDVARTTLGREARHVLLIHASSVGGARLGDLLTALEAEGAKLVSLDRALEDPLYAMTDRYAGPIGDSWLYRVRDGGVDAWVRDLGRERALGDRFGVEGERLVAEKALRIDKDLAARVVAPGALVVVHQRPYPSNSLALEVADGTLVLVGTPQTAAATARWLGWLDARFGPRKKVAINPHFHWDGLGGNAALLAAGIPIYGSTHTRDLLLERGEAMRRSSVEDNAQDPALAAELDALPPPPDHLFDEKRGVELRFGADTVRVLWPGAAHAADNLIVQFVERRLVFGGCLVRAMDGLGNTKDADLASWPMTVRRVKALDPSVVVPGHGERFDPGTLDKTLETLASAGYR